MNTTNTPRFLCTNDYIDKCMYNSFEVILANWACIVQNLREQIVYEAQLKAQAFLNERFFPRIAG